MKITEKQLQMLLQIAMDSLRVNIVGNPYFLYTADTRSDIVNEIVRQQSTEIIEVSDTDVSPEPEKVPEDFAAQGVSLLRRWRTGSSGASSQFCLTTDTIDYLDKYDKAVSLKEGV